MKTGIVSTCVVAMQYTQGGSETVALQANMDALPMEDKKKTPMHLHNMVWLIPAAPVCAIKCEISSMRPHICRIFGTEIA